MKKLLFIIILSFFSVSSYGQLFGKVDCDLILKAEFKKRKIQVCNKTLDVEIADNDWLRSIGLMCRKELAKGSGMLFIFDSPRKLSFWMKSTYIPLSIAYFTKDKVLRDVFHMEPLNDKKTYVSTKDSLYALEVNRGWFEENKIKAGCKLEL